MRLGGIAFAAVAALAGLAAALAHGSGTQPRVATVRASASPTLDYVVPTVVPSTPTPAPSLPPTAAPTPKPAPQARQCTAADIGSGAATLQYSPPPADPNSPIVHPGETVTLEGYLFFNSHSPGCHLPATTEHMILLDPSGSPVSWFAGTTAEVPASTGHWDGGGCGCYNNGPHPLITGVKWMCSPSGACSSTPLGGYTLVVTLTVNGGPQLARATYTVPVQAAS